jgi:hypothetical protein
MEAAEVALDFSYDSVCMSASWLLSKAYDIRFVLAKDIERLFIPPYWFNPGDTSVSGALDEAFAYRSHLTSFEDGDASEESNWFRDASLWHDCNSQWLSQLSFLNKRTSRASLQYLK